MRPSAPRFLNFGDKFQLPIVLQNQTDAAMTVDVVVRATNLALPDGAGRRVKVPANDRVEVLVPAGAELPGTARFQIGATSGRWADAAEQALPVWTPATTEAFATYGELDKGATHQAVAMPGQVVKYTVPGRRMKEVGVPNSTLLAGGVLGVVGFFVIPVVGLPLGFVAGVYTVEHQRVGPREARGTTTHALKAVGLSIAIELAFGMLAAAAWGAGALLT